jgi:putative nucleotidyltransferase with HDIG domain
LSTGLRLYLIGVVLAGALALAITTLLIPIDSRIGLPFEGPWDPRTNSILAGLLFWTSITLVAWALPVQLTRGSLIAVSIAPILAAVSLGGPTAGVWVAALGTTELREVRGRIPWYGTLANHAAIVLPAAVGGEITHLVGNAGLARDLIGLCLGATIYVVVNLCLVSMLVSLRTSQALKVVLQANLREFAPKQLPLAPLAWLMAQTYVVAWWASLLFALPLYTTRVAYGRLVEMREMFTQTISSLAQAVDKRDKYTSGHSLRVKEISVDIGREMRCSDSELEALEWGGLLHDVGKIGVPDNVLLKQERLTREERMLMNSHPVLGAEIISPVNKLAPELPIIRHHHEWYNGSGYPDRLMGDEIPRLARILHVADAFEAMTAARPYRMKPLTAEQALGELRKFAGIQFDPVVIEAFVRTKWVEGAVDPGRSLPPRPVPLISQAAGHIAQASAISEAGAPPADFR